jgi:GTP-binding protein
MDKLMRECDGDASHAGGGEASSERAMDSLSLERERGITIQAKYTSMPWRGRTLNAVDTPGHADFGGEVERVLGMVDGAVLLVDASEGPLAQTKFVVAKAVARGLRPILVLNKVDRDAVTEERCSEVMSQVFDLCAALGATDEQVRVRDARDSSLPHAACPWHATLRKHTHATRSDAPAGVACTRLTHTTFVLVVARSQLDFPILYASARMGWVADSWAGARAALAGAPHQGMAPLLDAVLRHVPAPSGDVDAPFSMVVTMMERDPYLGRIVTGRVASGRAQVGDSLRALSHLGGGASHADGRVTRILKRRGGFGRVSLTEARVGDIVSIAGVGGAAVTDTLAAPEVLLPLAAVAVDPPTLSMMFSVNDSPLAGRDGTQLTGSKIGARLLAEAESNVSITVRQDARGGETFEVQGRGELQLGVLIENMRREGFELSVSPPEVLLRTGPDGKATEPMEEITVEVDDAHVGPVIDALSMRGAEVRDMQPGAGEASKARIVMRCPSRGLLGFRPEFATLTRGGGVMQRLFEGYAPLKPGLDAGRKGVLVSMTNGTATGFALMALEERGALFIGPGESVYSGMIVGECARGGDMEVNPAKEKKLTNIRNTGAMPAHAASHSGRTPRRTTAHKQSHRPRQTALPACPASAMPDCAAPARRLSRRRERCRLGGAGPADAGAAARP